MIKVDDISRTFGKLKALTGVSMEVEPGEIVGLLGPSAAGKTTLVRIMSGADVPESGMVHVSGVKMPSLSALAGIGYMPQSDALYLELSGFENLQFIGSLFNLGGAEIIERIGAVSSMVGLDSDIHRPVQQYSGGMRRRLSLATCFLHQPKVIILDEPTVGMDPILRQSLWQEFRDHADAGATVLVTTHIMDEAERCDRVAMLRAGRLIAMGTPSDLVSTAGVSSLESAFLHYGSENSSLSGLGA